MFDVSSLTAGGNTARELAPGPVVAHDGFPHTVNLVVVGAVDQDLLPVSDLLAHGLAGDPVVKVRDDAGSQAFGNWDAPLK